MRIADIPFLSASELSQLIESREVSCVEAVESYLERIDALDFKFNSYLTVWRSDARRAALEADQAIAQGGYLGPMHGIPVAVKDQFWTKDLRTTGGTRLLSDFVPGEDATVIAKLKRAGAIILGKTNMTEFAMVGATHRYSTPRNPWNLDMLTGASSSGSAAATGAFLCATALGEDTGGSIRIPAAWCGLVGLNPSWGRVSRYGIMRGAWSMDAVSPISRTVEDAAMTLGAVAGHDPNDAHTWRAPVPDYRGALDGNISGMRIGLRTEEVRGEVVEPEVRDAVSKASSLLGTLGASVEEVSLPLTEHASIISLVLQDVENALDHRESIREQIREYGHNNRVNLLTGSIIPAQAYYKVQKLRSLLRQEVLRALERYDALVLPTAGRPAQPIEDDVPIGSKEEALRPTYFLTRMFNLSNAPSISVPCGFSAQGLPIGLMIGARPGGEETILKLAHAYERNTPWHTMRPPTV